VSLVLVGSLLIPLSNIVPGLAGYGLYDIATTTADAARAMWAGLNPYDLPIDIGGAEFVHNNAYSGYKYLPTLAIFYGVFGFFLGIRGIVTANIVLYAAMAVAIFCLCRRLAGQASWLAVVLFLCTPINSVESLANGATDIAPVFLVLMAFLLWGRSSFLAGILFGLSISMKPVPGIFAATLCIPLNRAEWWRYLLGIVVGALPALPYFVWSPNSFIDNVFFFNMIRPSDTTTWRHYAPAWAGQAAMIASLLVFAGLTAWCLVARAGLLARLYAFFGVTLAVLLAAPSDHDNYAIWWTPVLIILLGTLGARAGEPEKGARDLARPSEARGRGPLACPSYAASARWPLTSSPSGPAETRTVSPSLTLPSRMYPASTFCRLRWITRFSGRAP
jgi:hypothetical protein